VVVDPESGKLSCVAINERVVNKKKKPQEIVSVELLAVQASSSTTTSTTSSTTASTTTGTAAAVGDADTKLETRRRKEYRDARKRQAQRRCSEGHIRKYDLTGKIMVAYGSMYMLCPCVETGCANKMKYHPACYGPRGLTCPNCAVQKEKVVLELCEFCGTKRKEQEESWPLIRVDDDIADDPLDRGLRYVQFCKKHTRDWFLKGTRRKRLSLIIQGIQENWGSRELDTGEVVSTQPLPANQRYTIQRQPTRRDRFRNRG
jgi:hypothetical protein